MLVAVRLSPLAKNIPQRIRGNHKFNHDPRVADVTDAEYREISEDPYLKICNLPSVAWFDAFGIARTQKNVDKFEETPMTEIPESARRADCVRTEDVAEVEEDTPEDTPKVIETVGPDPEVIEDDQFEDVELLTKVQIIERLEGNGQVAGKDFDKKAKKDDLLGLLKTL